MTLAAATALLGAGVQSASASPAAIATSTNTCWQDVVNDWLHHNGQIKGTYAIPCYTQAIQHLNAYADVKGYSNVIDDIHRALLAAIHQDRSGGPPTNSGPGPGPSNNGPTNPVDAKQDRGWVQSLADRLGPGNARSIPLPLLVLGALALLLLLAAFGTWLARRIQTRRVTPAPAPAPLPRNPR
ncbi:MAG TPA: hypothetical protein VFM96_05870 [Gaiellaceae bacterium]|nr:hypothetical protein [Gaiellaceae bacterium]